jgi:hypothetical protein
MFFSPLISGVRRLPRFRDQVPRGHRRKGQVWQVWKGKGRRPRRLRKLQTRLSQVALQVKKGGQMWDNLLVNFNYLFN